MNITKKIENILLEGGIEEYKKEAQIIIQELLVMSLEDIMLQKEINKDDEKKAVDFAIHRAKTKEPLQYMLGYWYFMGERYKVNKNVLIPRDETEILVNCAYDLIKNIQGKINVLDIGVGSGIIACALAKQLLKIKEKEGEDEIEILGVDISLEALEVALENVNKLDLVRKVILRKSDLLSKIRDCEKFDLIVSNPPYIPKKEKNNLQIEVLKEPELALFTSDDEGIENYIKIIKGSKNYLKEGGFLAFELGINQAQKVKEIFKDEGYKNIEIKKDLSGIERVITAQKL